MELVAGEGEHVDVGALEVHVDLAHGLDAVGVEHDALLMREVGHLGHRIDVAGLVVRPHAGHQRYVAVESLFVLVKIKASLGVNVELRDLVATVLLEVVKHPENGGMLHRSGDDLPLLRIALNGGVDCGRV